jgi:death-on-curing family protein
MKFLQKIKKGLFCLAGLNMITLNHIRRIHEKSLEIDRENPDDYAPGERYVAILEHMLEYKIKDDNSVFLNAAIALQTIAGQHPFVNGNKRTGIATAITILRNEGYRLLINGKTDFIISVATPEKNISLDQIVNWIEDISYFDPT